MATIRKKIFGGNAYYYLQHTARKGSKVEKKELYLGTEIPENIEEIKRNFLFSIYGERWHSILEMIRKGYAKESRQMPKSAKEKETETFSIRFTYDTQRIEGSKLTLRETSNLLEQGITPKGKPIRDAKEAEAHKEVFYEMLKQKKELTLATLLYWHKKLFSATKPDMAGKIRRHQVMISGSRFIPPFPAEIYPLVREFFSWYNRNKSKLNPVELAAMAHLKLVTIHPFADGNGRISRLAMNFVLNKLKYPMLNIQYEGRSSYYTALERSQAKRNENIFLQWFIKRYVKTHKRYAET